MLSFNCVLFRGISIPSRSNDSLIYAVVVSHIISDIIPTPIPLHRAMALREARLRGEAILAYPTRSSSNSTAISSSISKGKNKMRNTNGKSSEKVNGKLTVPRERVRDSKGRWSLTYPNGSITSRDVSYDNVQKTGHEDTPYNYEGDVLTGEEGNHGILRKTSPQLLNNNTYQRNSIGSNLQRSGNSGNTSTTDFPLWTRIPLPRPPSTAISFSNLSDRISVETDPNATSHKTSQSDRIPPLPPPPHLPPQIGPCLSQKQNNNNAPLHVTLKRPTTVETSAMDVDTLSVAIP